MGSAYVGRFAPSPTGELHFGSLVAALGSCLQARRHGGEWRVRVEDLDPPREVEGSAERILADLRRLGFEPDGPVEYQSHRREAHEAALERLLEAGEAYPCGCTRRDLPPSGIYPGTCRDGLPPGKRPRAIRVRMPDQAICFEDGVQGRVCQNPAQEVGDVVVRRADGLVAYQLAVVVDDAWQGITEVVRGADLQDSTARQIHLQRLLGLPTPRYAHLPLVLGADGRKLSKQFRSDPVRAMPPEDALAAALASLGHEPPEGLGLDALWDWAVAHWDLERVPRVILRSPAGSSSRSARSP